MFRPLRVCFVFAPFLAVSMALVLTSLALTRRLRVVYASPAFPHCSCPCLASPAPRVCFHRPCCSCRACIADVRELLVTALRPLRLCRLHRQPLGCLPVARLLASPVSPVFAGHSCLGLIPVAFIAGIACVRTTSPRCPRPYQTQNPKLGKKPNPKV